MAGDIARAAVGGDVHVEGAASAAPVELGRASITSTVPVVPGRLTPTYT
ncbi:hypothetical protein [Streptomyces sp. NPDC002067]